MLSTSQHDPQVDCAIPDRELCAVGRDQGTAFAFHMGGFEFIPEVHRQDRLGGAGVEQALDVEAITQRPQIIKLTTGRQT